VGTTFCPIKTPKGKSSPRLMRPDNVHTPYAEHLGPLRCKAIEGPWGLLMGVGLKPLVAEHFIKELHPCHASEMVVACAGLAHGCVASNLAYRL